MWVFEGMRGNLKFFEGQGNGEAQVMEVCRIINIEQSLSGVCLIEAINWKHFLNHCYA